MSELHFLKKPFHSEAISDKKAKKYCSVLANGRFFGEKVAICLSLRDEDELDLISFREIRGPISHKADYYIVGVGKDHDDAVETVRIIVQDIYDKTGKPKLKEYFKEETFC